MQYFYLKYNINTLPFIFSLLHWNNSQCGTNRFRFFEFELNTYWRNSERVTASEHPDGIDLNNRHNSRMSRWELDTPLHHFDLQARTVLFVITHEAMVLVGNDFTRFTGHAKNLGLVFEDVMDHV